MHVFVCSRIICAPSLSLLSHSELMVRPAETLQKASCFWLPHGLSATVVTLIYFLFSYLFSIFLFLRLIHTIHIAVLITYSKILLIPY